MFTLKSVVFYVRYILGDISLFSGTILGTLHISDWFGQMVVMSYRIREFMLVVRDEN